MASRYVDITAADGGSFTAYLTAPPGHKAPGVIVIQEIFGINPFLREFAERLAACGYMAAVPDLFWRQEPGVDITDRTEAEWKKAFKLYQGFEEALGVADLIAVLDFLRAQPDCTGKVGCVGFCLGGKLAYAMATRSGADCSVGYYGVGIEKALDEATNITKPLMLHIAEADEFCPPEAQKQIADGLGADDRVTLHRYPDMPHAFARVGGQHYHAEAAALADRRSFEFFETHLS